MQAHDMPFTKLINVDQGAHEHFHVPKYQREYTWRKWQWDELLNDIDDNDPGYFMGSIICVNESQEISPGIELIYEVVDGQQRLTTLSLLLAAIHSKLNNALKTIDSDDSDERDELRSYVVNLRAKLVKKKKDAKPHELGSFKVGKTTSFLRVQPSAQNCNLADYKYLLSVAGVIDGQEKPAHCGNRLLGRAYWFFHDKLTDDVEDLIRLLEKINQLMFVQITVGSQSDAFTLFESLNNRGVPLSAMDIIKNKMLSQMEKKHAVDIDESYERWQDLIESIPEPKDQERFLRQFYNTFKHRKEVKVDKVTRATRSQIIRIYETLINRNAKLAFDELTANSKIYGGILKAEHPNKKIQNGLAELERINSAPAYQVLLYLFSLEKSSFGEPNFLEQVVELLQRYFIRRNVTDTPPTRQIDQGMIDLIESCATRLSKSKTLTFEWFVDELNKHAKPATLKEFEEAMREAIYETNSWMARYILIQIDQLHHSREYQPDFWARDEKGRFVWTVEHVLPQAEKLPDHWKKMIGKGDPDYAAQVQEQWVHCLGNLTLSGYNSDLAVAPFEKKQRLAKDRSFLGHKINIGYQNGLHLNSLKFKCNGSQYSLADAPHWDASMIAGRTKQIVQMALMANLLPGETISSNGNG